MLRTAAGLHEKQTPDAEVDTELRPGRRRPRRLDRVVEFPVVGGPVVEEHFPVPRGEEPPRRTRFRLDGELGETAARRVVRGSGFGEEEPGARAGEGLAPDPERRQEQES